jgi:hypothetical protein
MYKYFFIIFFMSGMYITMYIISILLYTEHNFFENQMYNTLNNTYTILFGFFNP